MTFNFNDIFNKPEPTELLADKSPCKTCEHSIKDVAVTDGYSDSECQHCGKKWTWIMDCLERLAWYEKKYGLGGKSDG